MPRICTSLYTPAGGRFKHGSMEAELSETCPLREGGGRRVREGGGRRVREGVDDRRYELILF
jgi:hypothetical protein